jgi:hypothetical protein
MMSRRFTPISISLMRRWKGSVPEAELSNLIQLTFEKVHKP